MGDLSSSWWVGFSPSPYQGRSGKGRHMCFKVRLFGNRLWNCFTAKEKMLMLQAKAGAQSWEPPRFLPASNCLYLWAHKTALAGY